MIPEVRTDLDFLSALVHGRRSRLAEASRLDELCGLRGLPELVQALLAGSPGETDVPPGTVVELQRRLVAGLAKELAFIAERLGGASGRVIEWLGARFQAENLKVLARGLATGRPLAELREFIVPLQGPFALDAPGLAAADSLETFISRVPSPPLRDGLRLAAPAYERTGPAPAGKSFFLEAGIDCGYLRELLDRAARVRGEQAEDLRALARQEADMFHLALAARGRHSYGLAVEDLAPFHVSGSAISREVFHAMLGAAGPADLVPLAVNRVVDPPRRGAAVGKSAEAPSPAGLELQALERFHRLADRIFRRAHVGLGVVAAYAALRRVELANLVTLSEGIRAGVAPGRIRRRLIPRQAGGAAGV